jgi:outer membrane lipoprotein-sorting protein
VTNYVDDNQLDSDLTELYATPVPDLRFNPSFAESGSRSPLLRFWRPAALISAVAAAAVAALVIAPSLSGGGSQTVSAAEIFQRASASAQNNAPAAGPQSYHLVATSTSAGQMAPTNTETWYADSSHQRTDTDWNDDGDIDYGTTLNGDEAWMYGDFSGTFRAVHGPAGLGDVFPTQSGAASVSDIISGYSGTCQKAAQDGEEMIAGREAYRIVVTADFESCPAFQDGRDKYDKFGTLVLDVDKETYLPLKTQQLGNDFVPGYTYEVTSIQLGETFPAGTFTYTAPSGVSVQDVADLTQAKNVLSGLNIDGSGPAQ